MQRINRRTARLSCPQPERILQFGGGNFLRAFADWIIDILNEQTIFNGSVVVIKPTEKGDYTDLRQQDGLFHVILNGIKNGELVSQNKLITCISRVVHPYPEWPEFLALAENPEMRFIISNTTESGIVFSEEDRFGDSPPKEFPAKLTAWLYHRYQCFLGDESKGCIFLPCELIEQNGDSLRQCILQCAEAWELGWDFQKWIIHYNYFYNTLVDRIVSGFPHPRVKTIQQTIGFQDALLVAGEYYHSWIIQAPKALLSELPFHKTDLNVQLVDDIGPYREMNVRLLKGAHTSMIPIGYLSGIRTLREVMKNASISQFILKELQKEIKPTLQADPAEIDSFIKDLLERFRNPYLQHQLISIALNSISKFKTRLLPSLIQFQKMNNAIPKRLVFTLASLVHFYKGSWQGQPIPLKDDLTTLDFFQKVWQSGTHTPKEIANLVLSNPALWGQDLCQIPGLSEIFAGFIAQIEQKGIEPVLEKLIFLSAPS